MAKALGEFFFSVAGARKDLRVVIHRVIVSDDWIWARVNFINLYNDDSNDRVYLMLIFSRSMIRIGYYLYITSKCGICRLFLTGADPIQLPIDIEFIEIRQALSCTSIADLVGKGANEYARPLKIPITFPV